jgi:hypothetical protein
VIMQNISDTMSFVDRCMKSYYSETSIHRFSGDRKIRTIHTGNVRTGKPLKIIDKKNLMIIITSC